MPDATKDERIAELEADNARLRRLLADRGMPTELRHQVRNTLATLRAIMRRSAETSDNVEDYAAHLEGRLDAILRVQSATLHADAAAGLDLHGLVSDELLAHVVREGEQAVIAGPAVGLQPRAAEIVALAVHELTTNAVEHGALTRPYGRVDVSWRIEPAADGPWLVLVWVETGRETPPTGIRRRGFGTVVLENMLLYELKAETVVAFATDGLRCTIRFPLPARIGTTGGQAPVP